MGDDILRSSEYQPVYYSVLVRCFFIAELIVVGCERKVWRQWGNQTRICTHEGEENSLVMMKTAEELKDWTVKIVIIHRVMG